MGDPVPLTHRKSNNQKEVDRRQNPNVNFSSASGKELEGYELIPQENLSIAYPLLGVCTYSDLTIGIFYKEFFQLKTSTKTGLGTIATTKKWDTNYPLALATINCDSCVRQLTTCN